MLGGGRQVGWRKIAGQTAAAGARVDAEKVGTLDRDAKEVGTIDRRGEWF